MGKYKFKDPLPSADDNGSGYESDDGTNYRSTRVLGSGTYATAKEFTSRDGSKKLATLYPQVRSKAYYHDFQTKFHFFRAIYPESKVELFINKHNSAVTSAETSADTDAYTKNYDYRLILPLIPGEPYQNLAITCQEDQLRIFISAIKALKQAHQHRYVVVDLKQENILYKKDTGRSYLIDGGFATQIGGLVPSALTRTTEEEVLECQKKYWHIAPECWSTSRSVANPSMDIYSLAIMFRRVIFYGQPISPDLDELLKSCESVNPQNRPTLDALETQLEILLDELLSQEFLSNFNV